MLRPEPSQGVEGRQKSCREIEMRLHWRQTGSQEVRRTRKGFVCRAVKLL